MGFVQCPTEITLTGLIPLFSCSSTKQSGWALVVLVFFLEFFVDAGAFPPTITDASDPYGIVLIGRLSSHDCRTGLPSK